MQSIRATATPDPYPSDKKKADPPKPCSIHRCDQMAAPGSSWCAAHAAQFKAIGGARADAPASPPDYLRKLVQPPPTPAGKVSARRLHQPTGVRVNANNAPPDTPEPGRQGRPRKDAPVDTEVCCEPGCNKPRAVSKSGKPWQRCREHMRDFWNSRDERAAEKATQPRRRGRKPVTLCKEPGCDKPRYKRYARCEAHQAAYEADRERRLAVCLEPGCDKPRMLNAAGKPLQRCREHQRASWRKTYLPGTEAAVETPDIIPFDAPEPEGDAPWLPFDPIEADDAPLPFDEV